MDYRKLRIYLNIPVIDLHGICERMVENRVDGCLVLVVTVVDKRSMVVNGMVVGNLV